MCDGTQNNILAKNKSLWTPAISHLKEDYHTAKTVFLITEFVKHSYTKSKYICTYYLQNHSKLKKHVIFQLF